MPGHGGYYFFGAFGMVLHPPLPLQEFLPLQPLSPDLQPPWPLHSFLPLQECLGFSSAKPSAFLPANSEVCLAAAMLLPLPAGAVARADVPYRAALRGRAFWLLTLAFGLIGLSGAAIRIHFIPLLIDTGLDPSTAAAATGVIGVTQVIGRVLFAPLDRRFSAHSIALGMFTLQAAVMGVLLLGQPAPVIALFILGFGAAQGVITLSRPSILAEQYGVSNYGRISSIMALFLTLISTGAPLLASLLYDRAGSYAPVLWLVFVCALAGCVVIAIARRAALRD